MYPECTLVLLRLGVYNHSLLEREQYTLLSHYCAITLLESTISSTPHLHGSERSFSNSGKELIPGCDTRNDIGDI